MRYVSGRDYRSPASEQLRVQLTEQIRCPRTHALFPAGARAFAVELLLLGHRLSRQPRFEGEEVSLLDIWVEFVMPHAVAR